MRVLLQAANTASQGRDLKLDDNLSDLPTGIYTIPATGIAEAVLGMATGGFIVLGSVHSTLKTVLLVTNGHPVQIYSKRHTSGGWSPDWARVI